jgi:hypothetical protein
VYEGEKFPVLLRLRAVTPVKSDYSLRSGKREGQIGGVPAPPLGVPMPDKEQKDQAAETGMQ